MTNPITRRDFLRALVIGAGAVAAPAALVQLVDELPVYRRRVWAVGAQLGRGYAEGESVYFVRASRVEIAAEGILAGDLLVYGPDGKVRRAGRSWDARNARLTSDGKVESIPFEPFNGDELFHTPAPGQSFSNTLSHTPLTRETMQRAIQAMGERADQPLYTEHRWVGKDGRERLSIGEAFPPITGFRFGRDA